MGYCTAGQHGQWRNLNGSFLLSEHTCSIAGSNVISSPSWVLSACLWGAPGGPGLEQVPREGDNLWGRERLRCPPPAFPPVPCLCLLLVCPETGGGSEDVQRLKVTVARLEEKQEATAEPWAFLRACLEEHTWGCCTRARRCSPIARRIVFFPTCQPRFL